jgi:rod shape determining protein RodA
MRSKSLFGFDILLLLAVLALMVIGILFIYSSGVSSTGVKLSNEYIKQIIWVGVGLVILAVVVFTDYSRIGDYSLYIYLAFLALLVITLFFGKVVNGARSWIPIFGFGFQPSEFAKIATVLYVAKFFSTGGDRSGLRRFATASLIVAAPMLLVLLQPDMGTALVFFPILLVMSFLAGVRARYILFVVSVGALLVILGVLPAWELYVVKKEIPVLQMLTNSNYVIYGILILGALIALASVGYFLLKKKYFYWVLYGFSTFFFAYGGSFLLRLVLKEYQIKRLIVFLDPGIDPQGAGWNVIQSVTAVGSGGFWGKGWLEGTQSHYRYLPQQSTDFIFSIIAEEWGFFGGFLIFSLFMIILVRSLLITIGAKDSYAANAAGGVFAMIGFHVFINMGMAMGIMPITGIPLLFLSYGGSSLWTALIGIGLLLNIHLRRYHY